MTTDKCREVLDRYAEEIPAAMVRLRRQHDPDLVHLMTMIPKMRVMLDEVDRIEVPLIALAIKPSGVLGAIKQREKFMRWLGFMQGVLWTQGIYTLDELKGHNRDDDRS